MKKGDFFYNKSLYLKPIDISEFIMLVKYIHFQVFRRPKDSIICANITFSDSSVVSYTFLEIYVLVKHSHNFLFKKLSLFFD